MSPSTRVGRPNPMTPGGQGRVRRASTVGFGVSRPSPLHVLVADDRGRRLSAPGLARWLARVAPARAHGTVTIALVGDACIRRLNRQYRGIDRATDVLSFPYIEGDGSPYVYRGGSRPPVTLGDIVIARGVARRQAREAGHAERTELRVLALHGLLHLLGYDHEGDRERMRRVERRQRRKGGLREGLIDRSLGRPVLDTPEHNRAGASGARLGLRRPVLDTPAHNGAGASGAGVGPRAIKR